MYVKLFKSIYGGSLAGNNHCLSTFIYLLANADKHGEVDIHPRVIASATGLTLAETKAALLHLEQPDEESRSADEEGRRIVRLDAHRDWGWRLVNYQKYAEIRNVDDRRESNRISSAAYRQKKRLTTADSSASVSKRQQASAQSAHIDLDVDLEEELDVTKCARANVQFEKVELHTPSRQEDFIGPPRTGRYVPSDPVGDYPKEVAEQAREIFQKFCMHHYGNVKSLHNDKQRNEIRHFAGAITTGGYDKLQTYYKKPPLEDKAMEAFQLLDHLGLRKPAAPASSAATEELKRKMLEEMNNIGRMS